MAKKPRTTEQEIRQAIIREAVRRRQPKALNTARRHLALLDGDDYRYAVVALQGWLAMEETSYLPLSEVDN